MNAFSQFVSFQLAQPVKPPKPAHRRFSPELAERTLDHIRRHPNQDVREIASVLDIASEQLHSVLQKMKRQGLILPKSGHGPRNVWIAL